jgi:hypothetical protein
MRYKLLFTVMALNLHAGCGLRTEQDPLKALQQPSITGNEQIRAMQKLDISAPDNPSTLQALHAIVAKDGYPPQVREEALNRLAERDLEGLKVTIRRSLPQSKSWSWVERVSQIIADRRWIDLTPALVSSWARVIPAAADDLQRPEYKALAKMHGADNVTETVYALFMQSNSVSQQGLRTRCWDLLHRLGQRQRLVALLASSDVPPDDALLLDLRAGAVELGIVPRNREEILWLRKLRDPKRSGGGSAEFWSRAVAAVQNLSPQRRAELELRDVPILVSASLHDPELLSMSVDELYHRVDGYLRTQRHHVQESNYDNFAGGSRQRLHEYKGKLTWGDLAAMLIAVRAMQVPQVVEHLFDYAERDMADTSTEYGGVIALDAKDRFEIREFPPVMRQRDDMFLASQAMLDAAYTSIFHFHMHAQNYRNQKFAGPGYGDVNYADNTRANCLVFTFLNQNTMNVDYYRHGRVVVDLGEIKKASR